MKYLKLCFILFITSYLAACAPTTHNTPEPSELITDERYEDQIHRIDTEREESGKESFSDLVEQGRVTKEYNGTEPIIVDIVEEKYMDDAKLSAEERTGGVAHDRIRVQEYFVVPSGKVDNDSKNENNNDANIDLESDEINPLDIKTLEDIEKETPIDVVINNPLDEQIAPSQEIHEGTNPALQSDVGSPQLISPEIETDSNTRINPEETTLDEEELETNDTTDEEPSFNPETAIDVSIRPTARPQNFSKSYTAWWDRVEAGPRYTRYTLNALEVHGDKLLRATNIDDADFCPNLNNLSRDNKKRFWLTVIAAMARWESTTKDIPFNPRASFREPTSGFLSRGLLQLDYRHRRVYKCDLDNTEDLYNPQKNLECGVKMITHLVTRDNTIRKFKGYKNNISQWGGIPAFWAVLRFETSSRSKLEERMTIKNKARELPFCR